MWYNMEYHKTRYQPETTTRKPPVIKGDQHTEDPELITKKAYMSSMWQGSIFITQDRVVAVHFWICGNKILRTSLAKVWRGRCARVQVVTEIPILPSLEGAVGNLESTNLKRRKRA